jgi:hypothetical protein
VRGVLLDSRTGKPQGVARDPEQVRRELELIEEANERWPLGSPPRTLINWSNPLVEELAPEHVKESLRRGRELEQEFGLSAPRADAYSYEVVKGASITDGATLGSTISELAIVPAYTIGANELMMLNLPGQVLRGRLRGRVTTLTTAATMTFRVRFGTVAAGVIVCQSGAIVQDTTAQTNTQWELRFEMTVRTTGATGTVFAQGRAEMASAALTVAQQQNSYMGSAGAATPATATIDMTASTALNVTGQWSLATAYSLTVHTYILERLN